MQTLIFLITVASLQVAESCWRDLDIPTKPGYTAGHCPQKYVGDDLYSFLEVGDTREFNCSSNFTYTRVDQPGSVYCFKPGETPVTCAAPLEKETITISWKEPSTDPVQKCIGLGIEVIFQWSGCNNVQLLSDGKKYHTCEVKNNTCETKQFKFKASTNGTFFFASGIGDGSNCLKGQKATLLVSETCGPIVEAQQEMYRSLNNLYYDLRRVYQNQNGNLLPPCDPGPCIHPCFCHHADPPGCVCPSFPGNDMDLPSQNITTVIAEASKMLNLLTPQQEKEWTDSSGCSLIRSECGQCFVDMVGLFSLCLGTSDLYNCIYINELTNATCFDCICQLTKKYAPSVECSKGIEKQTILVSDEPDASGETCDRNCSNSDPKRCVFDLTLEMLTTDADGRRMDGRLRSVLAYNKTVPGPPIVICFGDELIVNLYNNISGNMTNIDGSTNTTTLHFHGIREKTLPWSDGVPFVTQCPILPGESFTYKFNSTEVNGATPGTYWYHSHVGSQRTNGAYGALIIKENGRNQEVLGNEYDGTFVDDSKNIILLQEWYYSSNKQIPVSLLINGNGRAGNQLPKTDLDIKEILEYLEGKGKVFDLVKEEVEQLPTTNYTEYNIEEPGKFYRFRIIGAISQYFPLRLSVEDHYFTAIATDSQKIYPVAMLTDLWIAGGERYDILIKTKAEGSYRNGEAYKIRVFGYSHPNQREGPFCTIAWLKYPNQNIPYKYVTDKQCSDFNLPTSRRTLNPVPNDFTEWEKQINFTESNDTSKNGNIFVKDLRASNDQSFINFYGFASMNTHYIEFVGNSTFNNKRMMYPQVPMLLQDHEKEINRCSSDCNLTLDHIPYFISNCTEKIPAKCNPGEFCECQHVLKEPWAPDYWAEIVLINNNFNDTPAHQIHMHGGWFWVVGMGKYNHNINRTFIMEKDQECSGCQNLSRNFFNPPAKDTIQVPTGGYVILRFPLDNAGVWIFHCHLNYHVNIGMAMVLQIGELGLHQTVDPKPIYEDNHMYGQKWCTGSLKLNGSCKTQPPSPAGGSTSINWYLHMEQPVERCIAPGMNVTFLWESGHNVNELSEENYKSCNVSNNTPTNGDHIWPAPATIESDQQFYYFACGMGTGWHCNHGMKAKVLVSKNCVNV